MRQRTLMAAIRATDPDADYHSTLQFQPYSAHAESRLRTLQPLKLEHQPHQLEPLRVPFHADGLQAGVHSHAKHTDLPGNGAH